MVLCSLCDEPVPRAEIEEHMAECEYRKVECVCGRMIEAGKLEAHKVRLILFENEDNSNWIIFRLMSVPKEALCASGAPHMWRWEIWRNTRIIVEVGRRNVRSVESSSCSRTLRLIFKQTVVLNLLGRESLQWLVLLLAILHTLLQSNLAQLQVNPTHDQCI